MNHVKPLRSPQTSQPCSLSSNFFFLVRASFIEKPIVISEPAVASTRLLGLGSKLYPSNMPRMLNKDLTPSRVRQTSERKAPMAG